MKALIAKVKKILTDFETLFSTLLLIGVMSLGYWLISIVGF